MYTKINMSDGMLKQNKRWAHQVNRLNKMWSRIFNDDNPDKSKRLARALALQDRLYIRMGITLEVLITGVEA